MDTTAPGPLTYASAAFVVGALLEYPLAKRYPLRSRPARRPRGSKCLRPRRTRPPVSMGTRMLVAGGLAFASTYVVFYLVSALRRSRPQLP